MAKIAYEYTNLKSKTMRIIRMANEILTEYDKQGFTLTLRQLYYQFVARGIIPNNQREYSKLGDAISSGRRCGYIDWDFMVDRTRHIRHPSAWTSPAQIIAAVAKQYDIDWWSDQECRAEVWVEKDALIGVIERACIRLHLPYFSCRGYVSDSEIWSSAQRYKSIVANGQSVRIFHLGDHDPSGIDMTRDIETRLRMFSNIRSSSGDLTIERIALNKDQIDEYSPPPNFAKQTDSRFKDYEDLHGDESWELDALKPEVIDKLIVDNVTPIIDQEKWEAKERQVYIERAQLQKLSDNWENIKKLKMMKDIDPKA